MTARFPHPGPVAAAFCQPLSPAELVAAGLVLCPTCEVLPVRPHEDGTVGGHGCSAPVRQTWRPAGPWG